MSQTIDDVLDQRDRAEEALSQAYYLITGRSPEWSNTFGHDEALEDIKDAQELLRKAAKPPAPVCEGDEYTRYKIDALDAAIRLHHPLLRGERTFSGEILKVYEESIAAMQPSGGDDRAELEKVREAYKSLVCLIEAGFPVGNAELTSSYEALAILNKLMEKPCA